MLKTLVILLLTVAVSMASHHTSMCPNHILSTHRGKIIDIKRSIEAGAKLLKGLSVLSAVNCIRQCCYDSQCDLALHRREMEFVNGHNCYFVKCGDIKNCILADHDKFVTVYLRAIKSGPISHYIAPAVHTTLKDSKPHKETTTQSLITTTATSSSIAPTPPLNNEDHKNTTSINSTSDDINVGSGDHIENHVIQDDDHVIPDEDHVTSDDDHVTSNDQPCWRNGCDSRGRDIIAGVVVATVTLLIIFVVGGLVVRKLYRNRQIKHYHNVDYLINGMYS